MNPTLQALGRRLRLGLVGGSYGFIGPVHRAAARLDDRYELCAGVLSSNPERGRAAAHDIGIAAERAYASVPEMIAAERARADGIDAVAIMTPDEHHHPAAMAALAAGLHVICDKPLTTSVPKALELVRAVDDSGCVFCLTHVYSAYPMVRQARAMVRAGEIGEVRQIELAYVQGHLATAVEKSGDTPGWRFTSQEGLSLVTADIGTHAHHLGACVSGLELESLMADIGATLPGRQADDTAGMLLRWAGGARGTLWVTQAAAGAEHGLSFRIFASQGGLEWHQENPNELRHRRLGGFEQIITRRLHGALHPEAEWASRIEIGHPEGFQEAFANLYRDAAEAITAHITGKPCNPLALDFPTVRDGARGLKFVEAAVESSHKRTWVECRLPC